jgi:hypothetical protein
MGFFNNLKNLKDQALENERIQSIDQLQVVFNVIDEQAEKEDEKNQKEKEYYESLDTSQKVEYNRIKKRNKNLRRLGMYGLTVAGMATGVGIPVMMAANAGSILADDNLTFSKKKHDEKLKRVNKNPNGVQQKRPMKQKPKPREYFSINYDENGVPKITTLVDNDPYFLKFRYEELIRD